MVLLRSERDLVSLRKVNQKVARVLGELAEMAKPGVSTGELDRYAESRCRELGAVPAFKGYQGFPASLCISVNEEVVHGIPSSGRFLREGDIVSLDFGACMDGWYGDAACTVPVGTVSADALRLMDATRKGLEQGIEQARAGNRIFDIGHAIQNCVEAAGYSVVREFVGHGIGKALHEEPQVPNFGPKGKGLLLKSGMVLAIEPMVNAGSHEVKVLSDGWTAVTKDRSLSAHFEHTIAITADGPEILTLV